MKARAKKKPVVKAHRKRITKPTPRPRKKLAASGLHEHGEGLNGDEHEHGEHEPRELVIRRTIKHHGRRVSVTTTHVIEIDGVRVPPRAHVSDSGSLHSHVIPYCEFSDVLELAKLLADTYRS